MNPQTTPDLSNFWMPFTANRQFKGAPKLFTSAKGMYYQTSDGHDVLDATAGLWCVNAGHARPVIIEAIQRQAALLDYAPTFQLGHPLAFEAAKSVADLMPQGLDRIFFTNSGSESVDTALKIALAYHGAKGDTRRTRLIGRQRAYHGVGFGGISVGGIGANREAFLSCLLPGVDHLPHTYDHGHIAFTRGQPTWGAHLADELETLVASYGASTIAAVIVEPLAGSTGVLVPPKGYLQRLREICTGHGILLIFDEVITAFGRLGSPTAAERLRVRPDMITMAKGITSGAVPMGAVAVDRAVHDTIVHCGMSTGIEFSHGYTYSAHPLAAAASIATLRLYREEGLFQRALELEPTFEAAAHALRGSPHVRDIRNLGLVAGIELESRPGFPGARAKEVFDRCFEAGVLVRYTGDILAFSPPLIVTTEQISQIFATVGTVLRDVM